MSNALPKTSYVKMVDIFLLASLTVPFVEVRSFSLMQRHIFEGHLSRAICPGNDRCPVRVSLEAANKSDFVG